MIKSNDDLYASVRAISSELSRLGENEWSSALAEAISISTVPGEILGETRLQLRRLRATNIPANFGLEGRIDEALYYLDSILS